MGGLYAEPMGVDFSAALASGLRRRLGARPEDMARATLLVNTNRMARRTEAALAAGGATLLPRIGLVSQLGALLPPGAAPVPDISALGTRLRLASLVAKLLRVRPDLSPPSAAFDLADTLGRLLAEMQEEEVEAEALETLDVADLSEHWQRNLDFLRIVTRWREAEGTVTETAAQAAALERLLARWHDAPPETPWIVAGSTASRRPTRRLIEAVLDLPEGIVILPGLDRDMPEDAWKSLTREDAPQHDHPQYRHALLLAELGRTRDDVPQWSADAPAAPARNRLISLALRPAPVTDAWRAEGPELTDIAAACAGVTLLEAPSPATEAAAIATGLRAALAEGKRAALITPDRTLARQVAAQLTRWGIIPDDSAGRPLHQTAPGRLLLLAAEMRGRPCEAEPLIALLKHPRVHTADAPDDAPGSARRAHLSRVRALETELIRKKPLAFPDRASIEDWVTGPDHAPPEWRDWLCEVLDGLCGDPPEAPLAAHVARHRALVERLARGSVRGHADGREATGTLWTDAAGRIARDAMTRLEQNAAQRGTEAISALEYARILGGVLSGEEVRETFSPHPDVMIWGALEARVRTADLVILGGLNDASWPGHDAPDPWLSRAMRKACGLRPPEREAGLSAHDFQQAAAGPEIWLSRAVRTAEADTVATRWLNRLTGLLAGIGEDGTAALAAMRARGRVWLDCADAWRAPDHRHHADRAPRPAPILPEGITLDNLSVTGVETLIRDPYAIYAKKILSLAPLPPLRQGPDARVRGSAIHRAMEQFSREAPGTLPADALERLRLHLEEALRELAPWPGARRIWLGKFDRAAPDFLVAEAGRRRLGRPRHVEDKGRIEVGGLILHARADRIDDRGDAVAIYDYKTGALPGEKQINHFSKQLLLEAVMVQEGGFAAIAPRPVAEVAYLSLGTKYEERRPKDFGPDLIAQTHADLRSLIRRYAEGAPFYARLSPDLLTYAGDYDHLSRFGEWGDTDAASPLRLERAR